MTLAGMKQLALALLVAMLMLVALAAAFQASHPWLAWVRAFAEAAAVGAIADWIAVTALFSHPLGLPIPHTAIIPRNKDEIGATLGDFVEHNFLTPDNVIRKVAQQELARAATQWLADPDKRSHLAQRACSACATLMDRLADDDVKRFLDRSVTLRLEQLNAARITGEVLELLTADNRHQALLDHGLRGLEAWLTDKRARIRDKVSQGSWFTPKFVDAYVANRFVDGVLALLREAGDDAEHELRQGFDTAVREFIDKLKTSAEYRQRGEALVRGLVEHLRREDYCTWLWRETKARLHADIARADSVVKGHVERALHGLADSLAKDEAVLRKLDQWALQAIEGLLLRHRHQVSRLIAEVVKSWDAREVSEKIEKEIGRDLQYIRINGTVVGGLVGVALHAIPAVLA
jgi:uncharacterized membrane-anchored protein YjiN (DUF445 family)